MISNLQYKSKIEGECPSDYVFSKIEDKKELKFLMWMHVLQGIVARLHANIEMYDYYLKLLFLNDVVKKKLKTHYVTQLSNLSLAITIDFSCIFYQQNDLCLQDFKSFCVQNQLLFRHGDIQEKLKVLKKISNTAEQIYKEYFDQPRKKIFGHADFLMLDEKGVKTTVGKVTTKTMRSLLWKTKRILNEIWKCYNNHKLCFQFENGNDYKEITKLVCQHYGNDNFT